MAATSALLLPGNNGGFNLKQTLSGQRRKELRRVWRRLEEIGRVETVTATEAEAIRMALSDYFALEAGGWKGRAGTAAAMLPQAKRFMENCSSKPCP